MNIYEKGTSGFPRFKNSAAQKNLSMTESHP